MTKADVARNGLQAELKRSGWRATRRSFEQDARFLRKWSCAAKQPTALLSLPPPTKPGAMPNFDRLIRARFNNRDYGCHKQTHSACVRSGSVLTDLGAGPFQFDDGITQMELRKSRRVMFERGYDARLMAIDGTWHRACQIQDISETGAKRSVESSIEGLPLKEFFLVLSSTGTAFRRCHLAWVNGGNLGVYFKRPGEKKSKTSVVTGLA